MNKITKIKNLLEVLEKRSDDFDNVCMSNRVLYREMIEVIKEIQKDGDIQ